ncbi:MAG: aldo/keto reductase family protein [Planctomycetes bacterium]|nr:aldo/keto reductase family protein [Planctomycetota bacterium]
MEYRRLGKAGVLVSEIGFGTWATWGSRVDLNRGRELLKLSFDSNINFIDTADIYRRGEAEAMLGELLPSYRRSSYILATKLFWPMSDDVNDKGLSRKHIFESVDKSLQRMKTDYIDIYQCHRFDENTPMEETVRAMGDLCRIGKILYWGTSEWTGDQIEEAINIAREICVQPPSSNQPQYSMLARHWERDAFPKCVEHEIGQVIWSPLAQGVLTGKYQGGARPADSRATDPGAQNFVLGYINAENEKKIAGLSGVAKELGLSMVQLALAWTLRLPIISSAIVGATKPEQLKMNVTAAGVKLGNDVIAKIESILDNDPFKQ